MALAESLLAASLLFGANYADHATTEAAIARGGIERGVRGPAIRGSMAAAETGLFLALRKQHKTAAWVWVGVVVVGNGFIALHNSKVQRP